MASFPYSRRSHGLLLPLVVVAAALFAAPRLLAAVATTPRQRTAAKTTNTAKIAKAAPAAPGTKANDPDVVFTVAFEAANDTVAKAKKNVAAATAAITRLKELTGAGSVDDAALARHREMTTLVESLTKDGVVKALRQLASQDEKETGSLRAVKAQLVAAWKGLKKPTSLQRKDYEAATHALDEQPVAVGPAPAALVAAVVPIYTSVANFLGDEDYLKGLNAKLKPVARLDTQADAAALRTALPGNLPTVADVLRLRREFAPGWKALQAALLALLGKDEHADGMKDSDAALLALDTSLYSISARLPVWLQTLSAYADQQDRLASQVLQDVARDPLRYRVDASVAAKQNNDLVADLRKIDTAALNLSIQLQQADVKELQPFYTLPKVRPDLMLPPLSIPPLDVPAIGARVEALERTLVRQSVTVTLLQDEHLIDLSDFTSDQVSLYYFDDIGRLIKIFAPRATQERDNSLSTAAAAAHDALERATQDLLKARQEVTDAQREVALKQEEARLARIKAEDDVRKAKQEHDTAAQDLARREAATQRLRPRQLEAQRRESLAQARYDRAKADYDGLPANDPAKAQRKRDLDQATEERDVAKADRVKVDAEYNDVKAREDPARSRESTTQTSLTTAEGALAGTDGPLKAAQDQLNTALGAEKTALGTVRDDMANAYLLANKDVTAFAAARDNAPFWISRPEPTRAETDPTQRVMMFGFQDSKTLFIRGRPDDVRRVKEMVREFDRPQAQALLTLYTLELNSIATTQGATQATRALEIIDQDLAVARAQTDASLTLLRRCIADQVQADIANYKKTHSIGDGLHDTDIAAPAFFSEEVLRVLGWNLLNETDEKRSLLARLTLPNPTATTTLAEALIVLSLARQHSRREVMRLFGQKLPHVIEQSVRDLLPRKPPSGEPAENAVTSFQPPSYVFTSLYRFLDADPRGLDTADSAVGSTERSRDRLRGRHDVADTLLTNFQREMVLGIRQTSYKRVAGQARRFYSSYEAARQRVEQSIVRFNADPTDEAAKIRMDAAVRDFARTQEQLQPLAAWLAHGGLLATNAEVLDETALLPLARTDGFKFASDFAPLDLGREAAANELLKQMIRSVDEDVERLFIQPMFSRLRNRLLKTNVSVGIVNRTTVLGSNRLVARVDPRASANLALGQETNILQSALQLGELVMAAQTGGVSALAQNLKGLDRQRREPPPTIYGLATGNVFQVTPIADPTGQALRFRFDFVAQNQIREPNGASDPQLSRIERHEVNTEVQISNLEIREISRFDTNAKLGIPRRLGGGVPVLKDIPVLREVPLIGWFTKREGKAASVQQSLILGQTTLFPTITDVADLLTSSDPTLSEALPDSVNALPTSPSSP
jgi:hypothetical protein